MNNFLDNITTIEINTVIVEEIVEEIFIPWEIYQAVYYISRSALAAEGVHPSLHDRYLNLRRELELKYSLLSLERNSPFYNRRQAAEIRRNLPLLTAPNHDWENLSTRLPEPLPREKDAPISAIDHLFKDRRFVKTLRQLGKIKSNLDWRGRTLRHNSHSILNQTYAQTTISLDGRITNRYAQKILQHRDRQSLLKLHHQSVKAASKEWQELLKFAIALIVPGSKIQKQ